MAAFSDFNGSSDTTADSSEGSENFDRPEESESLALTGLELRNWRNFREATIDLGSRAVLVGPNASGKSNLLDALRFLRDVAAVGGGLAAAVRARGDVSRIRCLAARRDPEIGVSVTLGTSRHRDLWRYELRFGRDARKDLVVKRERVMGQDGALLVDRPAPEESGNSLLLSQTALEQVNENQRFRPIVDMLESIHYLHLVPQLVREPDRSVNHPNDPFGGDFLDRIARTSRKSRESRLRRINKALKVAVPQMEELQLHQDERGRWHLRGKYQHWRAPGAWQDEGDFSDGTLRLIGLLWSILDGGGPLLLEEPELSLHPEVVRFLPGLIAAAQRASGRQVILSTHSSDLLLDPGLGLDEVFLLVPAEEGTEVVPAASIRDAALLLKHGTPLPELVRARTRPADVGQLALFDE